MTISIDNRTEWLEADGLGGYASGTTCLQRTRRYHALLLTATRPPIGRMVLVNGLEAWIETPAGRFAISSQRYSPDVVDPDGASRIAGFEIEPWPKWSFCLPDGNELSQEIFVPHGSSACIVRWKRRVARGQHIAVQCIFDTDVIRSLHGIWGHHIGNADPG